MLIHVNIFNNLEVMLMLGNLLRNEKGISPFLFEINLC